MKITMPLYMTKTYKTKPNKKIYINLNNYRNMNKFLEHEIKDKYQKEAITQLSLSWKTKLATPITITYTLFVWDKRLKDLNNITSISDKYFSDALVEWWFIEDDNYNYVNSTINKFGGYEKGKGRLEIKIEENTD